MASVQIVVRTAEGSRVLLLEDPVVARAQRGRGLGRRLVEHVIAWGRDAGMTRITLLADQDNGAALTFYDRIGFTKSAIVVRRLSLT